MDKKMVKLCAFIGLLAVMVCICEAVPKYDANSSKSSFKTSESQFERTYKDNDTYAAPSSDRVERLGYTSGYGGINGYPHSGSGVGSYSPMKIDLGGVVLGAIIGIGALLIVPKVITAFNGGGYGGSYGGGNYRSADSGDSLGISDMMAKLESVLGQNNIDSSVCMQRAVCTYVRSSTYHYTMGTADQQDQIINAVTSNALVEYMLDGTAIKEAIEHGKNLNGTKDCESVYPGCPLDKQQTLNIIGKLLPGNGKEH